MNAHLSSSVQQQPNTLALAPPTGLVQWGDGVHCHDVDRSAVRDQLPQLVRQAQRGRLVDLRPLRPAAFKDSNDSP